MSGSNETVAKAIAQMNDARRGKVINREGPMAELVVRLMRRRWHLDEEKVDGASFLQVSKTASYILLVSLYKYPDGKRWLHASLSRRDNKLPSWDEIKWMRNEVLGKEAKAIVIVPPAAEHVNKAEVHHIWHCLDGDGLPDFTLGTGSI